MTDFEVAVFGERLRDEFEAPVTTKEWAEMLREVDQAEMRETAGE